MRRRLLVLAAVVACGLHGQAQQPVIPPSGPTPPGVVLPASAVNGGGAVTRPLTALQTTDCSVPAYAFAGHTSTGLTSFSATNALYGCANGSEIWRASSNFRVSVGTMDFGSGHSGIDALTTDGIMSVVPSAGIGNTFTRLTFGGRTASYPALAPNGAWLNLTAGDGTGGGPLHATLSAQVSTSDTITCSDSAEHNFSQTYQIPANYLVANKTIHIFAGFYQSTGSPPPTYIYKVRLGAVGVGGTVIYQSATSTPTANRAGVSYGLDLLLGGTDVAGASVNTVTTFNTGPVGINGSTSSLNTTAQPVAVATNAAQNINVTVTCSGAGTGTNNATLGQFLVEALN